MSGKAQLEPARHSVDCKLVSLHNICPRLPAVCYITSCGKSGSVWECEKCGVGKNSLKVLSRLWTTVHQIEDSRRGVPVDWQVCSRFVISCFVAERFPVKFEVVSKKRFLPPARGGTRPGEFGPNFSNSSHKYIVSKCGWDLFEDHARRLGVEKRKKKARKNHSGKM